MASMGISTRYILKQLSLPTVTIAAGLLAVVWLTQSVRYLDLIVNRGLSVGTFLHLTALLMPNFLVVILPISLFCAVAFVYNRLINDRELIVLRSAGLGQWRLARPALMLAVVATLVAYFFTLFLIPNFFRDFKDLQFSIRHNFASVMLQEGKFNTPVKGLTVYVRNRLPDGELSGLLVHDEREAGAPITMMAERGGLIIDQDGPKILLINGNRQQVSPEDGRVSFLYFDSYMLDLALVTDNPPVRWRDKGERSLTELFNPEDELPPNQRAELRAEAHQRLTVPLYNLAFVAIALGALLSGQFNRRGRWRRIATAVAGVVTLQLLGISLGSLIVQSPNITPVLYALLVAGIAGGLYPLHASRTLMRPVRRPDAV